MTSVLLEARPFRPFKSSEEYLVAMKEDLAEWLQTMYPHLNICIENFMEKLETGVALCEHANAVKAQAHEYVEKKQAKKVMTKSVTGSLAIAQNLFFIPEVKYFNTAKPGTFFARDNVSNFINWCKNSLKIIECLLFESDDLIMRKNEKHVILCLLEVARRGAKFGMLAPMLVQMERQIDREIAADQKKLGVVCNENENGMDDDSDSDMEEEEPVLMYGPTPQIITNDLKSLDEMVRDLVEKCTCPTQFPMIRVSEGKYRIGDTKVLIFVRILRNHVMVRVGGGWDTLSHYLDKHDPCRCRTQHRTTQSAKLVNKPGAADLHGSHVYYDRVNSPAYDSLHNNVVGSNTSTLGPPMNALNRSRSRSPTSYQMTLDSRRSVSPNFPRKTLMPPANRSRSPTPNYTSTLTAKLATNHKSPQHRSSGPSSLPIMSTTTSTPKKQHVASLHIPVESKVIKTETSLHVNDTDHSDTTSEVSDEGYRSLGIIQDKTRQRSSLYSQNSAEDADETDHQQVFTEEELNDYGLRKTRYSEKLYMKNKLEQNMQSIEKLSLSPTESQDDRMQNDFFATTRPKENTMKQREQSFSNQSEKSIGSPRQSRVNIRKENSFAELKPPSRAQSVERKTEIQKSLRKSPASPKKAESKINTWNGRSKSSRPSLTAETYVSPFTRNSIGRRSVSAIGSDRRASSTNTSPKKSPLKQEVLKAVQHADDDDTFLLTIKQLIKKHGSLNMLNDFDDSPPINNAFNKTAPERASFRSPRRDSKVNNNLSKIPAPVFYGKT